MSTQLIVCLTLRCNWRCRYCYDHLVEGSRAQFLDGTVLRRFLDRHASGVASPVIVTGGEPLLHPDVGGVLEALSEHGLRASMFTNGSLLDEGACAILGQHSAAVRLSTHELVSIENRDQLRSRTARMTERLALLRRYEIPVGLIVIPSKANIAFMPEIIDWANELRVGLKFQPLFEPEHAGADTFSADEWSVLERCVDALWFSTQEQDEGLPFADAESVSAYLGIYRDYYTERRRPHSCPNMPLFVLEPSGEVSPCIYRRDLRYRDVFTTPTRALVEQHAALRAAPCFEEQCLSCMRPRADLVGARSVSGA